MFCWFMALAKNLIQWLSIPSIPRRCCIMASAGQRFTRGCEMGITIATAPPQLWICVCIYMFIHRQRAMCIAPTTHQSTLEASFHRMVDAAFGLLSRDLFDLETQARQIKLPGAADHSNQNLLPWCVAVGD